MTNATNTTFPRRSAFAIVAAVLAAAVAALGAAGPADAAAHRSAAKHHATATHSAAKQRAAKQRAAKRRAIAKRVVALTPFSANTLAALGVRPVGVGQVLTERELRVPQLRGVPVLPLSHPNGPNMEQLAKLKPKLVLSTPTWRKGESVMRQLHIKVAHADPLRVAQVPARTRQIGRLVGRGAKAARIARTQQRTIAAARRAARSHPKVLAILGVGRLAYAFLPNSWGGDVVRAAGGRLVTAGLKQSGGFARISDELVLAENPDVIIAVPHGNPGDLDKIADYLRANPAWQGTNAVRNDRLYVSTDNILLQPYTHIGSVIRAVQTRFLKNR